MSNYTVVAVACLIFLLSHLCGVAKCQCELDRLDTGSSAYQQSSSHVFRNRIVFGTPIDMSGSTFGRVFVFKLENDGWSLEAEIAPADLQIDTRYGSSVALGDDFALVGAKGDDEGGRNAGAVYFFSRNGSSWTFESKFMSPTPGESEQFGVAMRLDEGRLMVGAFGVVYHYEKNGVQWDYCGSIRPSLQVDGSFGQIMDIDGCTLAVADRRDGGIVYLYEFENESWVEKEILGAPGENNIGFGTAVGIDGDALAVSQRTTSGSLHWVYLYEKKNGTWDHPQTLITRDNGFSQFASIALEGDYLAIGDDGFPDQVDIFYRSGRSVPKSPTKPSSYWQYIARIPGQDDEDKDFGNSLSMDSGFLVIGARQAPPFVWTLAKSICCRPHFRNIGDGTAGSWGFVPLLTGDGEDCITGSSRIYVEDCLGQSAGLLLLSAEQTETPFHDGALYVEAPWYPHSLSMDGQPGWPGSGTAKLPLPSLREWVGTTLFVQAVVLDSGAEHGVALSNGLRFQVGSN